MDKKEILERVKKDNVKFISFQFSDVTGKIKSVDAPVDQLEGALDGGIWFDGSQYRVLPESRKVTCTCMWTRTHTPCSPGHRTT